MGHGPVSVDPAAIAKWKGTLRGELLLPDAPGYEGVRKVYNGMIDRRPAMILRCCGVADAMSAVEFARNHNLVVSVRGGGHNVAGNAVCEGGLMIDMGGMKGMRVDSARRTARAEPGLTYREFDRETQAFGLATPGGTVSATGIAGLTLGGGIGWLSRKHGLACDNLISVDLLTAAGDLLTVSAERNQDLFWAVRGAGHNFGIVTSFEYKLHEVGAVTGGMLMHPIERARDMFRAHREACRAAPEEMMAIAGLIPSPDLSPVAAIIGCYHGPLENAAGAWRPWREFGPPVMDGVQPMTYTAIQQFIDEPFPSGLHNYWKSCFMADLSDRAIDLIVEHCAAKPSPLTAVVIENLGGAIARVGKDETAFSQRDGIFHVSIISRWTDPADTKKNVDWTRSLWSELEPLGTGGVYVNYLGSAAEDRVDAAYRGQYQRLAELKAKYDPSNFYRSNANVLPARHA